MQKLHYYSVEQVLLKVDQGGSWGRDIVCTVYAQLAQQRCNNIVRTSFLTLSQRCDMVENESCADVGF